MAEEIELKFIIAEADVEALAATPLLPGAGKTSHQEATYFDTPETALRAAGLSLRIRRTGLERLQTVKASGIRASGLFVRPEWERAVSGDTPVLDDTTPVRALLGKRVKSLVPQFEIDIERRIWTIGHEETSIELALDRGEARAKERSSPICEVELELKAGRPAALFVLARAIDEIVPVRLGVLAKAEQGYRLTEPLVTKFKAEPIALTADMTSEIAFRHVMQSCIRQYRLNEGILLAGRNAGALHQARIALRRLRSAFVIFRPAIAGGDHARLRSELRWLACEMGDARNLDVLMERVGDPGLREHIEVARIQAYLNVDAVIASSRTRALMLDLTEWSECGDWRSVETVARGRAMPIDRFAALALAKLRRKVKTSGRGLGELSDEDRHELRKNAKKLRYAAEFFETLYIGRHERKRYKRFIGLLEKLQDKLGALNDLSTAPAILAKLGQVGHTEDHQVLTQGDKGRLCEKAGRIYEDLIAAKRFWR